MQKELSNKEQERLEMLFKGIDIGVRMVDLSLKKCWRCNKPFRKIDKHTWQPAPCKHYKGKLRLSEG